MLTHTALLQLAVHDKMSMATFDTVVAYLHQLHPEELKPLYLKFPKRLAEACGIDSNQLYRVKKNYMVSQMRAVPIISHIRRSW